MEPPRGGSIRQPSSALWRTSSALSSPPWNSPWEDPLSHEAQDCGEPHLPFPPSHGTPQEKIHQAMKLRIAETLIRPLLPPMDLPRGGSIKPQSSGSQRTSSALSSLPVGLQYGITPKDHVITAYQCHSFVVMHSGTIKGVIAELLSRQDSMSCGKGGSMHIFTLSFFGGNGIISAQVPIGAGITFVQKYLRKKMATFALYGNGASNQGQVFEAFNMVCEPTCDVWNMTPLSHQAQDCGEPHPPFPPSHGTPHGRIHQATKPRIVETLICLFLPPMELPRGRSIRPPSPGLWRTSSTLFFLPWNSPGEDPSSHKAQDCRDPHLPSPPSHGTPKGKIHQATKLRIVENPIRPFFPPIDLPRGGPTKPQSPGFWRTSSALSSLP